MSVSWHLTTEQQRAAWGRPAAPPWPGRHPRGRGPRHRARRGRAALPRGWAGGTHQQRHHLLRGEGRQRVLRADGQELAQLCEPRQLLPLVLIPQHHQDALQGGGPGQCIGRLGWHPAAHGWATETHSLTARSRQLLANRQGMQAFALPSRLAGLRAHPHALAAAHRPWRVNVVKPSAQPAQQALQGAASGRECRLPEAGTV